MCVCVWISQAPIDKRQMDLHGSGLFRTGEKRSEGERRPAIVSPPRRLAAGNKDLSLTSDSSRPFEKVRPGVFN